jgi:nucleotide-binding universal stress UspA family protein
VGVSSTSGRANSASRPRVLVAYDGSEASGRAVERVARFMKEADVAVVTVARPIYHAAPYTGYANPGDENEARRRLAAARDRLERDGIAASGCASVGDAAEEILRTAEVFAAELIVLGARSLGTIGRFLLGSVSTKVMHESHCDVLIVK